MDLHLTGRVVDLVAEQFDVALRVAAKLQDSTLVVRKAAPIALRLFASPVYLARRGTPRTEAELWSTTASSSAAGRAARGGCPRLLLRRRGPGQDRLR